MTPLTPEQQGPKPHCAWCAKGNRPLVIALSRAGIRVTDIARHYKTPGLRVATCACIVIEAKRRGCLPIPKCVICGGPVGTLGGACKKDKCQKAKAYQRERYRRDKLRGVPNPRGIAPYRDIKREVEWPKPNLGVALGRPKKRNFVVAPPLCPTLGTVVLMQRKAI